jgi:hypothetical protein
LFQFLLSTILDILKKISILSPQYFFINRLAELEALLARKAEQEKLNTPEGKNEEKLRLQKMEEHANLVRFLLQTKLER